MSRKRTAQQDRLIIRASKALALATGVTARDWNTDVTGANVGKVGFELEAHVILAALGALDPKPKDRRRIAHSDLVAAVNAHNEAEGFYFNTVAEVADTVRAVLTVLPAGSVLLDEPVEDPALDAAIAAQAAGAQQRSAAAAAERDELSLLMLQSGADIHDLAYAAIGVTR